ncbi:MAG: copper-binding protein [Planctomycetota bacterium]
MPKTCKTFDRAIALAGASLFSLIATLSGLTGCSGESEPAPPPPGAEQRTDVYADILGVITQLPRDGVPSSEFKIYHEHIPGFKTRDGTVFVNPEGVPGMKAMDMPFPPGDEVDLNAFEVGDKVRFTFAVNWGSQGRPLWHVTRMEKIDADTEISYANKVERVPPADIDDESTDAHADQDHSGPDHDGHDHGGP